MKSLYLMLAIVGAVVPYGFFFGFIAAEGLNLSGFVSALFANGPAGGFTADLLISSVVFWIFMFSRPGGMFMTIGLSCALPAYLYATTSVEPPAPA
jgi:hypothetical protein